MRGALLAALASVLGCGRAAAVRVARRFAPEKDSECSDSPAVARETCLAKSARCMWLELQGKNLCLPCEWNGIDIPCAASGSIYPQGVVRTCEMACEHRKVITKVSACTDVSGGITEQACYAAGEAAQTRCIWTAYKTKRGNRRSICGPCLVPAIGKVPLYTPGNEGPEPGSRVEASSSQCEPPPPTKSGSTNASNATETLRPVPLESLGLHTVQGSPHYVAVRVPEPYGPKEYQKASEAAAAAAGWPSGAAVPPDAAFAIFGPDPEDDRLPLIRTIASSDPSNASRRYVLPPPGIMDMPELVRIGMVNATVTFGQDNASSDAASNAGERRRLRSR